MRLHRAGSAGHGKKACVRIPACSAPPASSPFRLEPGESIACVVASPLRDGVTPRRRGLRPPRCARSVARLWRKKIGARKIALGDSRGRRHDRGADRALFSSMRRATPSSPGPRNYDRIWIRDGSSQALALLWAGMIDEAKCLCALVFATHLRERPRAADPQSGRLTRSKRIWQRYRIRRAGRVREHRRRSLPHQAETGTSSPPSSSPWYARPSSSRTLAREPMRGTARDRDCTGSWLHRSVTRATASLPTAIGTTSSP